MNISKVLLLLCSHGLALAIGFALGIYTLPILTAPTSPSISELSAVADTSIYTAEFHRNLKDSDALHWGEGKVSISQSTISLEGTLAPGPNYKLYLSPVFIETEAEFNRLKPTMVVVGDVKTFSNFIVDIPSELNPSKYSTVIVWCEAFSEFITSAQYKP